MSKKKLIIGITAPGSVILLQGQLQYFAQKGYETFLLAPEDDRTLSFCMKEDCQLLPVKIEREISLLSDLKSLWQIIRHFRSIRPDIVNVGTPKMGLLGSLAAIICSVNHRIYTCRGFRYEHEKSYVRWILKRMEWLTAKCAHEIICISPSVKELGLRDRIFKEKKCFVINKGSSNGVELLRFNKKNISGIQKAELHRNLGLGDYFIYGFVGRIIDRKGILELFNAFCNLYKKDKNIRLLIVGEFDLNQISDSTLPDRINKHEAVIMPGRTDNVPLFLSLMDVFVLPAWWEGFGNVLVQAAAMGIPVIGTFGTGTRDAVRDGYNGILINVKDVFQLEKAMYKLQKNGDLREFLGDNGIEWSKNFDQIIIWKGMESLYLKTNNHMN